MKSLDPYESCITEGSAYCIWGARLARELVEGKPTIVIISQNSRKMI